MHFGTDGIRGHAGTELTEAVATRVAIAAQHVLGSTTWLIGWDTRESSEPLAKGIIRGVTATNARALIAGVATTPAMAYLSARDNTPAFVITASHNPYDHNGIKVFAGGGKKLSSDVEAAIEAALDDVDLADVAVATPDHLEIDDSLVESYVTMLVSDYSGLKDLQVEVGLDCANGAAYRIAPEVFRRLGFQISAMGVDPDGRNINLQSGSTHIDHLSELVVEKRLDVGFAFDGDADRVLAIDERGHLVDGDAIMSILALDMKKRGVLKGDAVAVTSWSNLGLHRSLISHGIEVEITEVGDRHVLERLNQRGLSLGGEQSGHIIIRDKASTGDGLLCALEIMSVLARTSESLESLSRASITKLPQLSDAVEVTAPPRSVVARLRSVEEKENATLDGSGRVVLRPSGTESIVRIMVEAEDLAQTKQILSRLRHAVESADD